MDLDFNETILNALQQSYEFLRSNTDETSGYTFDQNRLRVQTLYDNYMAKKKDENQVQSYRLVCNATNNPTYCYDLFPSVEIQWVDCSGVHQEWKAGPYYR